MNGAVKISLFVGDKLFVVSLSFFVIVDAAEKAIECLTKKDLDTQTVRWREKVFNNSFLS